MTPIEERVKRGADLLDEKYASWTKKVNTTKLAIQDPKDCVLGQLYGGYVRGLEKLDIKFLVGDTSPIDHGFCGADREELNAEWRRVIKERRRARYGSRRSQ